MRVVQVGIGGMGNAWLRAVLASPEVEYSGFVEVSETIAQEQVERYNLEPSLIFPSLGDALSAVQADGVINVTPPRFHKEISITALEAGVPVLSEKPLADSLEAAWDIVRKADETGVLHMVAQNYRYSIPAQTLKRVIDSGELGRVGAARVDFFKGPHFGGFREEMAYPLIVDMTIHHFDMMRFFLDSDPVSVLGRSWNPPWSWYRGDASASVSLTFANQAVVSYCGSWCSTGREMPWNGNWRFECEKGIIALVGDRVYSQLTGEDAVLVDPVVMEYVGQAYLLHEFYEAVTMGKVPATTCQDNIKSLAIVFDTVRAFETGSTVLSTTGQK